jgi:large subunit ribosomal protein L25
MTVILPVQPKAKVLKDNQKSAVQIAGVVYGPKFPSTAIVVDRKEFEKTFKSAGESTIIELQGLDAPVEVLIKGVVFAPIKGGIVHVDFYALEKGKEITTNVPLHFINESPLTKLGGVIDKVLHEVEVSCKPNNLPTHIDVDLSLLVQAEDKIHVSDLVCGAGVVITEDKEDVVAVAKMVTEEVVAEEAPVAVAEVSA